MGTVDQDLVDAINDIYGAHPHTRAAHAKGTWCSATFTASPAASQLSRAAHFRGGPVSALVRFSNGSGDPHNHDGTVDGRGMAVKFDLGDGAHTDIVALTLPVFFVRTPEDFLAFTRARKPDPQTGRPDPAVIGAYLGAHPEAMPAVQASLAMRPPASYAQCTYNGIHAFRFENQAGEQRFVRYRWAPDAGEAWLDPEDAQSRDRDYLRAELGDRLAAAPATFTLSVALAADDDPIDDPTAEWPADRPRVELGRLEITALVDDPERDGGVVVFDPTHVTDGIECSADRILHAREGAYSESAARRMA
jgi:catalase